MRISLLYPSFKSFLISFVSLHSTTELRTTSDVPHLHRRLLFSSRAASVSFWRLIVSTRHGWISAICCIQVQSRISSARSCFWKNNALHVLHSSWGKYFDALLGCCQSLFRWILSLSCSRGCILRGSTLVVGVGFWFVSALVFSRCLSLGRSSYPRLWWPNVHDCRSHRGDSWRGCRVTFFWFSKKSWKTIKTIGESHDNESLNHNCNLLFSHVHFIVIVIMILTCTHRVFFCSWVNAGQPQPENEGRGIPPPFGWFWLTLFGRFKFWRSLGPGLWNPGWTQLRRDPLPHTQRACTQRKCVSCVFCVFLLISFTLCRIWNFDDDLS